MNFDAFIFVDWSASARPTSPTRREDAIWAGELRTGWKSPRTKHFRSRFDAFHDLRRRLRKLASREQRVLIGFDFPYSYPRGTARALGLSAREPWRAIWRLLDAKIEDGPRNGNNRWSVASELNRKIGDSAGPCWGCPPSQTTRWLTPRRNGIFEFPYPTATGTLPRERITESRFRGTQEIWKLLGAGSVGSQALVGMPHVHRLRDDAKLEEHSLVWPFETDFSTAPGDDRRPLTLHAEIWPGLVADAVNRRLTDTDLVRDEIQVAEMCLWAARKDATGDLARYFDTPEHLDADDTRVCVEEEGWILGTPAPS